LPQLSVNPEKIAVLSLSLCKHLNQKIKNVEQKNQELQTQNAELSNKINLILEKLNMKIWKQKFLFFSSVLFISFIHQFNSVYFLFSTHFRACFKDFRFENSNIWLRKCSCNSFLFDQFLNTRSKFLTPFQLENKAFHCTTCFLNRWRIFRNFKLFTNRQLLTFYFTKFAKWVRFLWKFIFLREKGKLFRRFLK
jgi:hypothetical protein